MEFDRLASPRGTNGMEIKVQVGFTDDAGNDESLTSDGTAAVVLGGW